MTTETTTTDVIPGRTAIERITAGVNGGSAYQQARHEVWSAIRNRYDREFSVAPRPYFGAMIGPETRQAEAEADAAAHMAAMTVVEDAVEWAQILDGSVPAQQGSWLEIAEFRDQALAAIA